MDPQLEEDDKSLEKNIIFSFVNQVYNNHDREYIFF